LGDRDRVISRELVVEVISMSKILRSVRKKKQDFGKIFGELQPFGSKQRKKKSRKEIGRLNKQEEKRVLMNSEEVKMEYTVSSDFTTCSVIIPIAMI
jgi:hypothetical protein